jgi:hypothetical protein
VATEISIILRYSDVVAKKSFRVYLSIAKSEKLSFTIQEKRENVKNDRTTYKLLVLLIL